MTATIEPSVTAESTTETEWQLNVAGAMPRDDAIRAAIAPLTLGRVQSRTQKDEYWDSEDGFLTLAGYSLRVRSKGKSLTLTLKSLDELPGSGGGAKRRLEMEESVPENFEWEHFLAEAQVDWMRGFPGSIAELVKRILGRRQLQAVLQVRTQRRSADLMMGGQVVGELALDEFEFSSGGEDLPGVFRRIEIETEGDFQEFLAPAVEEIQARFGAEPAETSKYELGCALAEFVPSRRYRTGPGSYDEGDSIGQVAYACLRKQYRAFRSKEAGTRLGVDPEELHDMRVASRRMRAAFKIFEPFLPITLLRLNEELRWIAAVLGAVRDFDVQLETIRALTAQDAELATGLQPVVDRLEKQRAQARAKLTSALDSRRFDSLCNRLHRMLTRGVVPRSAGALVPALAVAPDLVEKCHKRTLKMAKSVLADPRDELVHELRKRYKRLRYAVEYCNVLYPENSQTFIQQMKDVQDTLGDRQDAFTAIDQLTLIAEDKRFKPSVATAFALGKLVQEFYHRKEALTHHIPDAIKSAEGKGWRRLQKEMESRRSRAWQL
ncbi:MAG: CHAD domain-containing protein [Fimbriimonadaceae bacterium]